MSNINPTKPRSLSEIARAMYPNLVKQERREPPPQPTPWWKQPSQPTWAGQAHLYGLKRKGK
jgi:hypothetical protein